MKKKILNLFAKQIIPGILVTSFVNMIMLVAREYIEPTFKYTFFYALNNFANEYNAELILKNFAEGDQVNMLIASVSCILHTMMFMQMYTFIITFISVFVVLNSVISCFNFALSFRNLKLISLATMTDKMKMIAIWIILYSSLNLMLIALGLPFLWYKKLAICVQSITFYWLFCTNALGYSIIKSNSKYN